MRRLIIVYSLLIAVIGSQAQVWRPLGSGLTNAPTATATFNHLLLTAHIVSTDGSTRTHQISVWNGIYWQMLPQIKTDSLGLITSLALFKGELYIGGKFKQVNDLDSSRNLVVWKDRKYSSIPVIQRKLTSFTFVDGMTTYSNRLLIYGPLKNTASINGDDLIVYNGNELVAMPVNFGTGVLGNIGYINAEQDDMLVIGGRFSKVSGQAAAQLAYFKNGLWTRLTNNPIIPQKIAVHNSLIYFFGNKLNSSQSGIYKVSGSGIDTIEHGIAEISKIYDLIQVDGVLYASGVFTMDDNDQTETRLIVLDGGKWHALKNGSLLGLTRLVNYKNTLVATGHFTGFSSVDLRRIAQYVPNAGIVTGRVFFDKDKNCIFNNRDEQLNIMAIQVLPENIIIRPNDNGRFFAILEEGNHSFKILTRKYWYASECNGDEIKVNVRKGQVHDSASFAMLQYLGKNDLSVNLTSTSGLAALKNRHNAYRIDITNKGSSDVAETKVVLHFDQKLDGLAAKPAPDLIAGDSAVWTIADFYSGESRQIACEFELTDNTSNTVELEASIELQENEEEIFDNSSSLTQYLEEGDFEFKKQVFPSIGGDTAYISDTSDKIQYQISFANYTTDTIRNVYVVDTIGLNHSLTHVRELGASHPYSIQIYSGQPGTNIGIIVYTFNNINLPPNPSKNPEIVNNRGYVAFELGLTDEISEGIVLTNQANVTFDYFDPELTNWVYAIVDNELVSVPQSPLKSQVDIYPNPTWNHIHFELPDGVQRVDYSILNTSGKQVMAGNTNQQKLFVGELTPGMYYLHLTDDDLQYRAKFIKF